MATPITTTRLSAEEEQAIRNFTTNEDGLSRRGWMPHEKGGWDRIGNRISTASAIEWQLEWDVESLLAELTALREEKATVLAIKAKELAGGFIEIREAARREALEEAAKEIEDSGCPYCGEMAGRDYALGIRSLAQPKTGGAKG